LITYRETYLLVDNYTSTQKTKQEVSLVVAHELAHQWFGNLVVSQILFLDDEQQEIFLDNEMVE
jgi:hypothetical protein